MRALDRSPIRTPIPQWWREFRVAYCPPFMFFCLIGTVTWMWSGYIQPLPSTGGVERIDAHVGTSIPAFIQELNADAAQGPVMERRPTEADLIGLEATLVGTEEPFDPLSLMLRSPMQDPERKATGLPMLVEAGAAREIIAGDTVHIRVQKKTALSETN